MHNIQDSASVAIIVLNWNGWQDTIECLESLQQLTYPNYQIIVVDNGSTDGSVERIKAWARGEMRVDSKFFDYDPHTKPVRWIEYDRAAAEAGGTEEKKRTLDQLRPSRRLVFIQTGKNLGASGGYNVGTRYALERQFNYVWLMNNDVVVDPACLRLCVKTLDSDPRIGVVGPKILYYRDPLYIWYAGGRFRLWCGLVSHVAIRDSDDKDFSGTQKTEHVCGCSLLTRRETLEKIGLRDEDFFIILGDADWSARVQRDSDFTLAVNLNARVWHKEGGISSSEMPSPANAYFYTRNRFLITFRYGSWLEKLSFATLYTLSRPIKFGRLYVKGRPDLVRAQVEAIRDFLTAQYGPADADRVAAWRRGN